MNKKTVLVMAEAHYLNSGFGTYAKELLSRLHKTGKYNLVEFASYGSLNDARDTPWLFISNLPANNNQDEHNLYNSSSSHQFGSWRFDKVCLDVKPDIVLSYRDPWMDDWISHSVLRPYFHWVWMPTVDSAPQRPEWINIFSQCDAILSYSEYGGRVLKQQGKESINWIGCASPGIDPSIYKPMPKMPHRQSMGIDPDCFIVGTVMRNQKRKLFFELMKAFRLFLDKAPPEIANKTYLYLHTSYPEKIGWDLSHGILEHRLGGKVLMTYICKACKNFFPHFFQDAIVKCQHCKQQSAVCPTVSLGLTIEDLAKIYNLFDIYAQYAICEGFGMPQVEASASGIPVAATDYSAMYDVVRLTKGYPIPVRTFFKEMETNAERAYPDNEAFADILVQFFQQTSQERMQQSIEVRKATLERYDWGRSIQVWEKYIDSYQPKNLQGHWNSPAKIRNIPTSIPPNLSHREFIKWIFVDVIGHSNKLYSEEAMSMYRNLVCGAKVGPGQLEPIDREQIFTQYKARVDNNNTVEAIRTGQQHMSPQQFLIDAHQRHQRTIAT
jgi:glycosyltransferase involved in cell wall biosynthesis